MKRGFTLIELSIVLVIIALIVGGVLVGRDLIHAAKLRKVMKEKESFATATNAFVNKYGGLPGDLPRARSQQFGLFTFNSALDSQLGSGLIENNYTMGCETECGGFWTHLSQAGLIQDQFEPLNDIGTPASDPAFPDVVQAKYQPKSGFAGYWSIGSTNTPAYALYNSVHQNKNAFVLGIQNPNGLHLNFPLMSPVDMQSIDSKFDDGRPGGGVIVADTFDWDAADAIWWQEPVDATSFACTTGGSGSGDATVRYNADPATGGNATACVPTFVY